MPLGSENCLAIRECIFELTSSTDGIIEGARQDDFAIAFEYLQYQT